MDLSAKMTSFELRFLMTRDPHPRELYINMAINLPKCGILMSVSVFPLLLSVSEKLPSQKESLKFSSKPFANSSLSLVFPSFIFALFIYIPMGYIIAKGGYPNLSNVKWIKLKTLGGGSYGVVHLVKPANSISDNDQVFAVKSCYDEFSSSLRKELKILRKFNGHPNIVQCYDGVTSLEQGREVYNLFLEFAPGGTLLDLIQKNYGGMIPEGDARCYVRMLFEGVQYIHARGYVHCDLKPENILVYPPCQQAAIHVLKIADFGLARELGEEIFEPGARELIFPGTPLYMPPESINAAKVGCSLDIWSLGCIFLQMITGKLPWKCDNMIDLTSKLLNPMECPEIPEDMSSEGRDFLTKCFERDASSRWTATMLLTHPFLLQD